MSLGASTIFFLSQAWQPYPGSVLLKATCIAPLAVLVFRVLRNFNGRILALSLCFSSVGDVFLALNPAHLFVPGLTSFLVTHGLYIGLFARNWERPIRIGSAQRWLILWVVLYSGGMAYWLFPSLGKLSIPVAVYLVGITSMVLSAVLLRSRQVLFGAGLFLLSDSLIAVNRFKFPVFWGDYLIWATYYFGQLGIVCDFLRKRSGGAEKAEAISEATIRFKSNL